MSELVSRNEEQELEITPSFDFVFAEETARQACAAEHKSWLKSIRHERPLPKDHFNVAVYIRYFNQTRYDNYLDFHKKQFLEAIGLCPNWRFVDFYIDEGASAPNMENAAAWSALLEDCSAGKVDLIITQKVSNVSRKPAEIGFCARLLAAQSHPVGIYFISEDIYTLASYYQGDLRDDFFLPSADWRLLPDDDPSIGGVSCD